MTPTLTTLIGDCRQTLATLPEASVHCCITSPPYFALRRYTKDESLRALEIGSEETPAEFIDSLIEVFRAVRRVLRDDGVLFVNMGETYSDKQRLMMPERLAMAMQADGWLLRDVIIWHKPSPMPSSVDGWRWERCRVKSKRGWSKETHPKQTLDGAMNRAGVFRGNGEAAWAECQGCDKCRANDGYVLRKGAWRTTTAHEPVFVFTKSDEYFCDAEAVKTPAKAESLDRANRGMGDHKHADGAPGQDAHNIVKPREAGKGYIATTANPRSVWTISTEPLKHKHYAAFPSELPRRCILVATSARGCCPACGSPWARIVAKQRIATRPGTDTKVTGDAMTDGNRDPERHVSESRTLGWRPTCNCNAWQVKPETPANLIEKAAAWFGGRGLQLILNGKDIANATEELRGLQNGNSREGLQNGANKVLLQSMHEGGDSGHTEINQNRIQEGPPAAMVQGQASGQTRLCAGVCAESSKSGEAASRAGASACVGSSSRSIAGRLGGASHQWNQERQQDREFAGNASQETPSSARSRANQKAGEGIGGRSGNASGGISEGEIPEELNPFVFFDALPPIPCAVLDPFGGAGTTAKTAIELGRSAVQCELNPEYVTDIQAKRLAAVQPPLFGAGIC